MGISSQNLFDKKIKEGVTVLETPVQNILR